jgi:hypothetical protein
MGDQELTAQSLQPDPALHSLRRYFDAHVHSANWGSCRLLLRLPLVGLGETTLQIHVSRADRQRDFAPELARLMARNGKRKAWVDRLIRARLWREPAA